MAKSPSELLDNKSNQMASIHRHIKSKHTNNTPQQSAQKTEATEVNAIMIQLDDSDGDIHLCNSNTDHFTPLFESEDEEGTNPSTKPKKIPVIVLSEYEDKEKNKG